jgi:hypothetical protein
VVHDDTTQSLSLVTGERKSVGTADVYYRSRDNRIQTHAGEISGTYYRGDRQRHRYDGGSLSTAIQINTYDAYLTPYTRDYGWAGNGSMFLVVQISPPVIYLDRVSYEGRLDIAASAESSGTEYLPLEAELQRAEDGRPSDEEVTGPGRTRFTFEVDESLHEFYVELTPSLKYFLAGEEGDPLGSAEFEPMVIQLNYSQ